MKITAAHASAILAFTLWGLFPIYWKIFAGVSSWDLFGHRILWSFITLFLIIVFKKKISTFFAIWKNKRLRTMLFASSLLISSNWLLYIYAVNTGKILEASMGYFLNPLINVFMGRILLKENLRPSQWPAIILAFIAIIIMAIQLDLQHFPWIALTLAVTFALYGLIRKIAQVGSLEGLAFETSFVTIPVLIFWFFSPTNPITAFEMLPIGKSLTLMLAGLVTCTPLILFAYSAKRMQLQTLGFIQYLSPSFKFLCGLLIFHEPLSPEKMQTFFLIWIALAWYTAESYFFIRKIKNTIPITK